MNRFSDTFVLFDLLVEVTGDPSTMVCSHHVGDYFEVQGENIIFPPGQPFSLYALAALLPLLPAKQRRTEESDWMSSDELIACPDPHCGARFRITRVGERTFSHAETTRVPLKLGGPKC